MVEKINNQEHNLYEVKDKELFDRIAFNYMQKDIAPSSAKARQYQLLSAMKTVINQKDLGLVIDIGCGIGATAKYLQGKYKKYIGVDYSIKEIQLAKKFNRGNCNANFFSKNVKNIVLCQRADTILSIGALHHMTNLKSVFLSLHQIAKPGTTFLVIEPYKSNIVIQTMRYIRKKIDPAYSESQRYFTTEELVELFKKHHLKKIKIDYQGFFSPFFAQVVFHPQFITRHLSQLAILIDSYLNRLPLKIKKLISFNIIISGKF